MLKTDNKKIIDFYNKYTNLDFEKVNLVIIELFEQLINDISGKFNKNITSEILSTIKTQTIELETFKNELKSNIDMYKTIQNLTNTNVISEINIIKDSVNKLNIDITNSIISKFYDIRKENSKDLELIINKNSNDTLIKIIEKIEKEQDNIINKTNNIIKEIIPNSQNQIYNNHELTIKNFKDDLTKNIENIKSEIKDNKSDISLDKLNLLINEKNNLLINTVENNILNYITNTEQRLKNNLNEIKDVTNINQNNQEKLNLDLLTFLNQYKVGSKKGEFGEKILESILTSLFPSSEIINSTSLTSSGDFILKRENKIPILIENKNYDSMNVSKKEVEKFIYDTEQQNYSGIMMSQKTGIALKNNFQIDINNKNVLIYIHNMNNDPEKILLACNIIDHLTNKINDLSSHDNTIKISENTLQLINEQYQRFISKKESIIYQINDNAKKIIESIRELELNEINNILSNSFANTKIITFKCDICNIYIGANNKSLSSHKRFCKQKKPEEKTSEETKKII